MRQYEKFEAAIEAFCDGGMDTRDVVALFREAAALARRVEDAPVVTLWSGDHAGAYEVKLPEEADSIQIGQRVRLVPEAGQGGGDHG